MGKEKCIVWESQHLEFDQSGCLKKHKEEEKAEELLNENTETIEVQNMMQTPWGIWHVNDDMNPFRQFEFWMAYTNFSIGPKASEIISRVPGVEVLSVLSRYRFIVGFGKLFKVKQVAANIEQALCGKIYGTFPSEQTS